MNQSLARLFLSILIYKIYWSWVSLRWDFWKEIITRRSFNLTLNVFENWVLFRGTHTLSIFLVGVYYYSCLRCLVFIDLFFSWPYVMRAYGLQEDFWFSFDSKINSFELLGMLSNHSVGFHLGNEIKVIISIIKFYFKCYKNLIVFYFQ